MDFRGPGRRDQRGPGGMGRFPSQPERRDARGPPRDQFPHHPQDRRGGRGRSEDPWGRDSWAHDPDEDEDPSIGSEDEPSDDEDEGDSEGSWDRRGRMVRERNPSARRGQAPQQQRPQPRRSGSMDSYFGGRAGGYGPEIEYVPEGRYDERGMPMGMGPPHGHHHHHHHQQHGGRGRPLPEHMHPGFHGGVRGPDPRGGLSPEEEMWMLMESQGTRGPGGHGTTRDPYYYPQMRGGRRGGHPF